MEPPPPPWRRFGQNFLADRRVIRRILDSFDPRPGEPVLEIGPGRGALTGPLLDRGVRLLALEIDERLAESLADRLETCADLHLVRGDALELPLDGLVERLAGPEARARLLANLPYNVATPILRRVLESRRLKEAQVLVQDEVADRLTAGPGEEGYGPLAVICALRGGARRLFRVGPEAFRPRPRVVSAAVRLTLDESAPLPPQAVSGLLELLHRAFASRRKTLVNNLAFPGCPRETILALLETLGLDPRIRAERVPAAAWIRLRDEVPAGPPPGPGEG